MKSKLVMMQVALLLGWVAFTGFAGVEPARAMSLPAQPAEGAAVAPARENLSASPDQDGALLENLLVRERLALSNQQSRLMLSHTVAESTQEYINRQQQAGKDTAALEAALAAFNQAIASSEANNASAGALLANPAGFDADGQVVDANAALQTLRDAGRLLRQAHLTLTQATLDLRIALQTYRGN
jgi:exonuclease VII small subunit